MKTICSWCGVLMKAGTLPVSHGCCESCQVALIADLDAPILAVEQAVEEAAQARRQ